MKRSPAFTKLLKKAKLAKAKYDKACATLLPQLNKLSKTDDIEFLMELAEEVGLFQSRHTNLATHIHLQGYDDEKENIK
jgi:hypothetical protein